MSTDELPARRAPRRPHGALKNDVLELLLHADGALTAKQIRERFSPADAAPALSTVLTVLDRLRRAGQVQRHLGDDGELRFAPVGEETASTAHSMLDSLLRSRDRTGALLSFAGSLDDSDLRVLRAALGTDPASDGAIQTGTGTGTGTGTARPDGRG